MLNPELDNVEQHFIFLPNGEIYSETIEGKMSIEVYGLNRGELIVARRKVIDELIKELLKIMIKYENPENRLNEFFEEKLAYNETKVYSRLLFFINSNFNDFIIEPIKKIIENK